VRTMVTRQADTAPGRSSGPIRRTSFEERSIAAVAAAGAGAAASTDAASATAVDTEVDTLVGAGVMAGAVAEVGAHRTTFVIIARLVGDKGEISRVLPRNSHECRGSCPRNSFQTLSRGLRRQMTCRRGWSSCRFPPSCLTNRPIGSYRRHL